ncbi:lipoamide acyltransferase component of branched-chain alpha-keto acid dehydrogenase complex [Achlya hypogyna]|uniref:Dihydrolipoamide acetyltransferase component of pyruvate dehydrogenase complex n=1 Tax=Achlya hypogyna TaxID=1202772 RepID=A0A1V9YPZ4_ACHHY|nr:lipoamide acyltransferase component of branched-chain alpha-keto acid dehydrogenase complex [Achlya hypogyna]
MLHLRRSLVAHRAFHSSRFAARPEISFKLSDIGEGIAEVEVLQWFVKPGDKISQFQNLVEVQSDKATVEITSRFDGTITKLHYEPGQMAKVGSALIDLDVSDEVAAAQNASNAPKSKAPAKKVEPIKKAAPSPAPIAHAPTPTPAAAPVARIPIARANTGGKVLTTPSVRRLAREHNIDLEDVPAEGDRILKGDILNYIKHLAENKAAAPAAAPSASSASATPTTSTTPAFEFLTESTTVPVTPIQKMMVKSMNAALKVPHFGYADEIEMNALDGLRTTLKPLAAARGVKVTYLPLMIKAASLALKYYPILNASVSDDEAHITMHAHHNISVAMDTPKGLLVPNVKNVESKSILDIAEDLQRLQKLGAEGKLGPNDLTGGTFSLSNIGSIGGTYMSPVIMVPQVAIGALGKIQTVPRFNAAGDVVPVKLMNVSWSGDHRVIDGATMARFSTKWKDFLENPVAMLTELK